MPKNQNGFRIEVFRSGTFKPMTGDAISYSADDLAGIVEAYDPETAPAPIVVGHPSTDDPAFGWATGFEYDHDSDRLFAELGEVNPAFADQVRAGAYKKVSLSFFRPEAANNPTPGKWYPKHIGFLGAAAPAVSGLAPIQFAQASEGELVTFEAAFGEPAFEDTAGLFRNVRDFLIEKFGLEDADRVLPSYQIDWLADAEVRGAEPKSYSFADPNPKEITMTPEEIAALEAREQKVAADEAAFAERAEERRKADNADFAESLVKSGKLLPAKKDGVVAMLNALPVEAEAVAFAEGKNVPLMEAIRSTLEDMPVAVDFSTTDMSGDPNNPGTADFASDGKPFDADQLAIDGRARAYQSQNPGTTYVDAVKAVS